MELAPVSASSGQPVRSAVEAYYRHRRLFLSILLGILALVVLVTLLTPKKYASEAKLLLENTRGNTMVSSDRSASASVEPITELQINSELEVLLSDDVVGAVADSGWTQTSPSERTPDRLKLHEDLLKDFSKRIKIEPGRKSNIIEITYLAPSSPEATNTLTSFLGAYLDHRRHITRPAGTSNFFASQAAHARDVWQVANRNLINFQQGNQLVSVRENEEALSKQIADDQVALDGATTALSEARTRISAGNQTAKTMPSRLQTQQRSVVTQAAADQMRTVLVGLQNHRTELLTRYQPTNRLVVEVDQQIADTEKALSDALAQKGAEDVTDVNPAWQQVETGLATGGIDRQGLATRVASLGHELSELQGKLARLQALDVQFSDLEEKQDQARSTFELLSSKRDQAQIDDALDEQKLVNVGVAESPTSTFKAASPRKLINGLLGLVTALFLALGALYISESSRSTVATPRELEANTRYPVLATMPAEGSVRGGRRSLKGRSTPSSLQNLQTTS